MSRCDAGIRDVQGLMKPSGPCRRKRRWCDWLEGTPSAQIKQAISRAPLPEHAGRKKNSRGRAWHHPVALQASLHLASLPPGDVDECKQDGLCSYRVERRWPARKPAVDLRCALTTPSLRAALLVEPATPFNTASRKEKISDV